MAKKKQISKATRTGAGLALVGGQKKTRGSAKRATSTNASEAEPTSKVEREVAPNATDAEELVVFAFRLTRADRDAIHAAAGPAKASRFVKTLAIAAATGDVDRIHQIVGEVVRPK
jgi:hypothetical protein